MDSRRHFLGKVATGIAGIAAVPARVLGANERIRVGILGFGDRGAELLQQVKSCAHVDVAAVCDVFSSQLDKARALAPNAATYSDDRKMLDESSIDAVVIATPPHFTRRNFARRSMRESTCIKRRRWRSRRAREADAGGVLRDAGRHAVADRASGVLLRADERRAAVSYPTRSGWVSITAIDMRMYRNTPRGKPQWSRTARVTGDVNAANIVWDGVPGRRARARVRRAVAIMNWRLFLGLFGRQRVTRTCRHQLAFWYRALDLQIPKAVTMSGGVYLWKDGREVPDTMNVSLEQPEEILISWASGVREQSARRDRGCAGRSTAPFLATTQVRYLPQKINRPDGNEMTGRTMHVPHAHMQNFFDCIRERQTSRTARSSSATAYRSPRAWRWTAIASAGRCDGTQ